MVEKMTTSLKSDTSNFYFYFCLIVRIRNKLFQNHTFEKCVCIWTVKAYATLSVCVYVSVCMCVHSHWTQEIEQCCKSSWLQSPQPKAYIGERPFIQGCCNLLFHCTLAWFPPLLAALAPEYSVSFKMHVIKYIVQIAEIRHRHDFSTKKVRKLWAVNI